MIKFSIIMPVYNCELYLRRAINSILRQSYKDFELIIINDGSTDNSLAVINSFNDKRIRVISKDNTGVSDSRNIGIKKALYDYICFLDADDYFDIDALSVFCDIINRYNPDLICCGIYSEINGHYDCLYAFEKFYSDYNMFVDDLIYLYSKHMLFNVWNKVYKKSIIDEFGISFPCFNLGEDRYFNSEYIKHINSFYNSSKCLYHYVRSRKDSIMNIYNPNLFDIRLQENNDFVLLFKYFNLKEEDYIPFIAKQFIERTVGCIESVFSSNLDFKNRYSKIKNIVYNYEVEKYLKYYVPSSIKMKILIIPIKYKLVLVCYFSGWVINMVKNYFPVIFNSLKNKR